MDQMEEKLSAILSNPHLMQQVMSMAQSLGSLLPRLHRKNPRRRNTSSRILT